ncbi:GNAT family N-acetyltransferase [Acetobacter sp.]|uniref:GNAT family N-acetyltransferase n=1 Tax=Acetobacter sp. TaxID=440 RepID=UPI0039EC0083
MTESEEAYQDSSSLDYRIVPLSKAIKREGFFCGRERIDNFFLRSSVEQHTRNQIRVHVAVEQTPDGEDVAIGFCSLCVKTLGVRTFKFGKKIHRWFERHDEIPIVYLSMLGVSQNRCNRGVGSFLLGHALDISLKASKDIGIHGIALDAATDELVNFYEKFGFALLENNGEQGRTMFIASSQIEQALA